MQLYQSVRQIIETARLQTLRAVNSVLLNTYWQIGRLIVEDEQDGKSKAAYGKEVIKTLSQQLTLEFGKGFDLTNLSNMRKFYLAFPILDALRQELSWTHYRIISRQDSAEKRLYYVNEAVQGNWNIRQLEGNINSLYFERRATNNNTETGIEKHIHEFVKDPYILEFTGLAGSVLPLEKDLEDALITHLQKFLLELGKGFAFVARQQHIVTDTSDFYIDLVFYNYILKCFVLIDLKKGKLTHQDIGQMDMYIRMYNDLKTSQGDQPTIGIILCAQKDETIVKYSVLAENKQLFASQYLLYLPKEEELRQLIEQDRQLFELNKKEKL